MSNRKGASGQRKNDARRVRVKTAKGRTVSSQRWLERQLNDPYVREAKSKGYRSRAAFKLKELDRQFRLLKPGMRVLDLGAAPGGWSQVAAEKVGPSGLAVAVDILEMAPLPGVTVMQADIADPEAMQRVQNALGGLVDVVLSDMAAPTTGHRETDRLRTAALLETAADIAEAVLKPGGSFAGKIFQGGADRGLLLRLKQRFRSVKHVKPPASRARSPELYLVALGFRP